MNRLLQKTNFLTAKNNSMFWVGASSVDPKRSISVVNSPFQITNAMFHFKPTFIPQEHCRLD
jgi:hypothetical protein